ncbi:MAG: vWA domain-containing protein, partial [Chitinophagales bacterium]
MNQAALLFKMNQSLLPKLWQKMITYLIVVLFLFMLTISTTAQNRSVGIVYDNSGSMQGTQCDAVNYALQAMVGVLSPDDDLFVITMSDQKSYTIDLGNKQKAIDQTIKQFSCKGGNPLKAVNKAIDQLGSSSKSEKWLLMLTDGEWQGISNNAYPQLSRFIERADSRTLFLNLDVKEADAKNKLKRFLEQYDLFPLQTLGQADKIIAQMGDMATTVMSMPSTGIQWEVAGDEVQINSLVPLKRLIVIEQAASAALPKVVQASASDNTQLKIEGPFNANKNTKRISLTGKISHLRYPKDKQVIPEGTIKVKFDQTVSNQDFKFLPEVAAKLEVSVEGYRSSRGNTYAICDTMSSVRIVAKLLDLDGQPLNKDVLRKAKVNYVDGKGIPKFPLKLDETNGAFTLRFPVSKNMHQIRIAAEHEDYFNYQSNI